MLPLPLCITECLLSTGPSFIHFTSSQLTFETLTFVTDEVETAFTSHMYSYF